MGDVVGDILPAAVGFALSPLMVVAVILMLFSPRAPGTAVAMLLGVAVGAALTTTVAAGLTQVTGRGPAGEPSAAVSWARLVLGVLMVVLAFPQWRKSRAPDAGTELPKWMEAIEAFRPGKAFALGLAMAAANPKNLAMCLTAGATIGANTLPGGNRAWAVTIFAILGTSTVAVPVVAYLVAADRVRHPLDRLKAWLQANNSTVVAVTLLILGVSNMGKGMAALW